MTTSGSFKGEPAPCGRVVAGERFHDNDSEIIVTQGTEYACGCKSIQREYHDGSVSRKIVRHDGRVLLDELLWAE